MRLLGDRDPPYLHDKVIGLISTAGKDAELQASAMEFSVRALRGWAVPYVVPVASASRVFDGEGQIQDETVELQLRTLGSEVVRVAKQFASDRTVHRQHECNRAAERVMGRLAHPLPLPALRKDRYEATVVGSGFGGPSPPAAFQHLRCLGANRPSYPPLSRRRHNRSVLRGKAFVLSAAAIALAGASAGFSSRRTAVPERYVPQATCRERHRSLQGRRLRTARRRELQDPEAAAVGPPAAVCPAAFACMSQDAELGNPGMSPTKIVMTLPSGTKPFAVIRSMGRCETRIGDPPAGASFQLRGQAVIVYLPKYCILDKKTIARTAPPRHS